MMARPLKNGLDYFPLDVYCDDKLKLLIAEFGMVGFGVVISLLQKIYGEEGYYTVLNDSVVKLFAHEKNVGYSTVLEIIKACIRLGIFDFEMYKNFSVLTSEGIQKRYIEATSRREKNIIENQYLLINAPNNSVNVNNNSINVNNNSINVNNNTQSKVKESKYKGIENPDVASALSEFESMRKKIKKPLTEKALERLINKLNELASDDGTKIKILNQSVDHCWQDIYELRGPSKHEDKTSSINMDEFFKPAWRSDNG